MEDKKNNFATLVGGVEMEVTLGDGTVEKVFVSQLAIKRYPELLGLLDDEGALLELYCGKEKGWAEGLTPGSHELLIVAAEKLNADFFWPWLQRRLRRMERVRPGVTTTAKVGEGQTLPSLRPRSP